MKTDKRKTVERDSNLIGDVVFRYLPYWPLFLLLMLTAFGSAWLYLKFATPLYESNARVLIKDEKKGTEDSKALEGLDHLSTKKIVENEIEVIQSRTLLNKVVKNLNLYAPVYKEKGFKTNSAYTTSPVTIELKDVENLKETDEVSFSYDKAKQEVVIDKARYPLNKWVPAPYGDVKFSLNPHYQEPGQEEESRFYFSLVDPKNVTASIRKRLKVSATSKLSTIVNLNLRDEVPERGEDILNGLLAAYNQALVDEKNVLAANTMNFVEDRLKSVESGLDSIERRIQQYKSGRGAIDISTQGKLFLENVSSNDQKLSDINMQLAILNQVEGYVQSKNGKGGIVPSTLGVSDPTLSQLVDKLYASELEYESLRKTVAENNPMLQSVTDRIEKIKPGILENIRSQRRSLETSRNNLNYTNNSYASVLKSIPEKERQLIDINREQNIKNDIYTFLLQKREETALSNASTVLNNRIVDKAESSDKPVSPKSKVIYLIAILIALLVGAGIVMGKETLSQKILFRHEIESMSEYPIIGEIPSVISKDPIVIGNGKKTFIAEQFRKLRATLNYIGVNLKRKRILVTSSISGEGKSFVATNLALTLALTGKKVVLLDFDLNNPSLSKKLDVADDKGVSEYLRGEASEPEEIIRSTRLHQNLSFISAGNLPEDPSELIMNGKVEELLNQLDAMFDYIVIDTAPVGPVTDAYVIATYCDGTLYIIRHGYTPKVCVERIDENNKLNQLPNVGIVFNGVQPRGFGNKNYGYGYGYGYGYIYNNKQSRKRIAV